ncbi:hypothetical protein DFJ74DRAFT_666464 [Hyaloraphidium curvatum]|nr:hypothetical protein DFJ74DRAFT_666464 [Hyaloraphidium curvatum]
MVRELDLDGGLGQKDMAWCLRVFRRIRQLRVELAWNCIPAPDALRGIEGLEHLELGFRDHGGDVFLAAAIFPPSLRSLAIKVAPWVTQAPPEGLLRRIEEGSPRLDSLSFALVTSDSRPQSLFLKRLERIIRASWGSSRHSQAVRPRCRESWSSTRCSLRGRWNCTFPTGKLSPIGSSRGRPTAPDPRLSNGRAAHPHTYCRFWAGCPMPPGRLVSGSSDGKLLTYRLLLHRVRHQVQHEGPRGPTTTRYHSEAFIVRACTEHRRQSIHSP